MSKEIHHNLLTTGREEYMLKNLSLILAVLSFLSMGAAAWAADMNFSADIETESQGRVVTSKMYLNGMKSRMETGGAEQSGIAIARGDKRVTWVLMPSQKMYMEMAYKPNTATRVNDPKVKVDRKFIKNDTVDGHPTKNYHVTAVVDGKKESGYEWEATDLKNMVVKYQSEDKKTTTTWKNIKIGGGSDGSLYEIPKGYKKMTMPSMDDMGGMKGMRRR
jgi:hypothetical protein